MTFIRITPRFFLLAAGSASSSNRAARAGFIAICTQSRSFLLDGLRHHRAVRVARHADEARDLLLAQLVEGLDRPVRGLDLREVRLVAEAVEVQQVEVVGLQALQARLDLLERRVARARPAGDLGREEDVLPARGQEPAQPRLALAVAVVDRGVEVVDAEADRLLEDGRWPGPRGTSGSGCRSPWRGSRRSRPCGRASGAASCPPSRALSPRGAAAARAARPPRRPPGRPVSRNSRRVFFFVGHRGLLGL